MKLNHLTIRIDKRYSAACETRWLRGCQRLGAKLSNDDIRRLVIRQYGWFWKR